MVLRSEQCFYVSCPKHILKLEYHLVLTRVAALVSKMLAKYIGFNCELSTRVEHIQMNCSHIIGLVSPQRSKQNELFEPI